MRFSPIRIAVVCVALLHCTALRAQESEWPAAMLELEKLALQSPRRNTAFAHLAGLAAEGRRLDEWRARWETRASTPGGAAESLLLGWLDIEAGRAKEARVRFARAAEIAPENPHAQLAHAEALLRSGDADGETHARRAAELLTDTADKAGALRLPAVVAQEKGEFAAAWAHLGKLEREPLDPALRIALMPDFARAHLALGDWEKWSAALLESSGKGADTAATCAAACLALGDPATAHRVVLEALKRTPADALLRRLAITAATAAGFGGDAAVRIEASLGAQPSDDDLAEAINALAALGAPQHARRIFSRHAVRLAPISARWRQALPPLWRLGGTGGLRALLAPHATAGGWELQLALGELAIMDKDTAAAEQALWRLFAREFDASEVASTARALATKPVRNPLGFPLAGQGFTTRLSEMEQQFENVPAVFRPGEKPNGNWWVNSLADGRDIALCYLRRLASDAGGDAPEKFLAALREHTAHWPPGDRLLAFTAAGNPEGMLDAADGVAALAPTFRTAREFARVQLARLRALPSLPPESATRAAAILERIPAAAPASRVKNSAAEPWHARLQACWRLFDAGKFSEGDTAFAAALRDFATDGTGPEVRTWASFHASLISSLETFRDPAAKTEAAAYALRWIGMQAPRRADWPSAPQPAMLWRESSASSMSVMFASPRQTRTYFSSSSNERHFPVLGGSLPEDLLTPLHFFNIHLRGLDERRIGEALVAKLGDLPDECACTALLARGTAAAIGGRAHEDPAWSARLRNSRDAQAAQLALASSALVHAIRDDGEKSAAVVNDLLKAAPGGPVARAAWLGAALHLIARREPGTDAVPAATALERLPATAEIRKTARAALETLSTMDRKNGADLRASNGRLAQAWLGDDSDEPLPGECEERLRALVYCADVDAAAKLAREILAQPPELASQSQQTSLVRREAVRTLDITGDLAAWFSALRKNAAQENPQDMRRVAEAATVILQTVTAVEPQQADGEIPGLRDIRRKPAPRGGLTASLLADARTAQRDAMLRLVRLEPEELRHWTSLLASVENNRSTRAEDRAMPVIENETLLRGAKTGLPPATALRFAGDDPNVLADLASRWPSRSTYGQEQGIAEIAGRLWRAGNHTGTVAWLRKMPPDSFTFGKRTVPSFLIEAYAARNDSVGIVDALAAALLHAAAPAPSLGVFTARNRWGYTSEARRPFGPLLDEAHALGLGIPVAEKLALDPARGAAEIALLLHARERAAAALPAISARLAQPMMPLILEEFAEQLADWPEGRECAQSALRALEPEHTPGIRAQRASQLARRGWLAARCGMRREATEWLDGALKLAEDSEAPRVEILLLAVEGLSRSAGEERAKPAAAALAKLFSEGNWDTSRAASRLRELAAEGDAATVRLLSDALSGKDRTGDTRLAAAISDAAHTLGLREGKADGLTPFAWVRARHEDGTGEVAWALGYFSKGRENARTMNVPNSSLSRELGNSRLEIFLGTAGERLERLTVIENAAPSGVWRGRIPQPAGDTAATFSADGAAVFGPPMRMPSGENLLPPTGELPGKLLPSLLWKKRAEGPDGETIFSAHGPGQISYEGDLFGVARIEIPKAEGKDLVITGWTRQETPSQMSHVALHVLRSGEGGRWTMHNSIPGGPLGGDWQHFEFKITAAEIARRPGGPGAATASFALRLLPGCAYSGLRVTAAVPQKNAPGIPGL